MSKISKTSSIKFAAIIKQRQMEQKRITQEKAAALLLAQEQKFDEFLRSTAKDILQGTGKYQLKVFNANESSSFDAFISNLSVWAPWSKLSGQ